MDIGLLLKYEKAAFLPVNMFQKEMNPPFATEDEAWTFARKLSGATNIVNIYVIYASDWTPVEGYNEKLLKKY